MVQGWAEAFPGQMKYISQNTFDRPSAAYLLGFIEKLGE